MSNKTQLQLNNETLASILSNVLGLPSQESLKHGAYVWKKSEYTPSGTISVSFISTSSTETKVQLSSSDVDLNTLQDDDFITLRLGGTMDAITISSKVYTKYKFLNVSGYKRFRILTENESYDLNYGYSFNATTNILTLTNLGDSSYALPEINLSSMVVPATTGDFVDFVVSDSPTAYPDGGEQGGYWYEKINPFEVLLEATGCTKMAVDKFTFTSGTVLTTQVSHSLGQVPTLGFVYTSDEVENASPLPIKLHIASSNNGFLSYKRSDGTLFYGSSSSKIDTSKTTSDKLCFTASNIYQAGLEYTLITMA